MNRYFVVGIGEKGTWFFPEETTTPSNQPILYPNEKAAEQAAIKCRALCDYTKSTYLVCSLNEKVVPVVRPAFTVVPLND